MFSLSLPRLQNESEHQSQSHSLEVEMAPGSCRNDPRDKPRFTTSTQQEQGCSWSPTEKSGGEPGLGVNRPTSCNQSAENRGDRGDGLAWSELTASPEIAPESTTVSPNLKTTEEKEDLKISNNKSQDKEKHGPQQRSQLLEAGHLPSSGAMDAPFQSHGVESTKARQASVVSEAGRDDEQDSGLTHVPRRLPKLQKEGSQSLCRSTTRVRSLPPMVPLSLSIPSPGPEKRTRTPKRKRQKSAQVEEPEPEGTETMTTPVGKLAQFTFQQKTKLTHCPEGQGPVPPSATEIAVDSSKIPQQRREVAVPVAAPAKLPSTSGDRYSDQLQGKTKELSRQPPERNPPREESPKRRVVQPELELGNQAGHVHLACAKDREEVVSRGNKGSKVHAGTIARLANFSFTSPSESKSESLPPKQKDSHSPLLTTAPVLGQQRQSFQLQQPTERANRSTLSLFTLSELDDEALDFDWDEELRKKP